MVEITLEEWNLLCDCHDKINDICANLRKFNLINDNFEAAKALYKPANELRRQFNIAMAEIK